MTSDGVFFKPYQVFHLSFSVWIYLSTRRKKKRKCCCLSPHKHREINQGCKFDLLHGALFARWHLHANAVKESRWQSKAESHKSARCRTSISPCRFLSPTAPREVSLYKCSYLGWYWDAELYCLLSQLYYKTMSGFRLNFLVQVTLCWEPRMAPPWALSQGAAARGPFSDSLQESCHQEGKVTPTPLPSWIHMRLVCLRSTAYIHQTHSSLRSLPPLCSNSSKISLTRQRTESLIRQTGNERGSNDAIGQIMQFQSWLVSSKSSNDKLLLVSRWKLTWDPFQKQFQCKR